MEQSEAHIGHQEEIENNQTSEETHVEEKPKETPSMESLMNGSELDLDFPTQGEIRQGLIATIRENEVFVSVGTKSEGVISGREFEQIPEEERSKFEVGQEIPVYVVAPEDQNGNVVLSYTRAREEQDWEEVARLLETGDSYTSEVIGFNKGGLIVPIGRLRGFVPASQVSVLRRLSFEGDTPEERWGTLVGEEMQISVIEMDRTRRRLILSERQALQETRETLKDRLLDELEVGSVHTGRVTSLADFGAFVNIEGADGLVHLSEISWERIQHPNEVLKVGQEVDVKVISVDHERKRIGLSIRQLLEDPWVQKVSHLREGLLVEGTITHLTKFGAFARIGDELEGLVHVSELSEQRIAHPKEIVHEGDVVTLRIIKIDTERRRIGLSLRKVDSPAYADLDWKMALADEVDKVQLEEIGVTTPEAEVEVEEPATLDEAVEEVEQEIEISEGEPEAEEVIEEVLEIEAGIEIGAGEPETEPEALVEEAAETDDEVIEEEPLAVEEINAAAEEIIEAGAADEEAAETDDEVVEEEPLAIEEISASAEEIIETGAADEEVLETDDEVVEEEPLAIEEINAAAEEIIETGAADEEVIEIADEVEASGVEAEEAQESGEPEEPESLPDHGKDGEKDEEVDSAQALEVQESTSAIPENSD